ncbi:H-type small acid-soluble spore protein [Crassaminicella indica]|uniref:H-type small acid-soluble spore protein n=1 Tax=Crassaminicella indica TaxID=2855394 RepID=A0ABX8REW0_9CLOT|nr:H-type small acid-soluble spore protein [Crassaminicella indica]QXM06280.1 H-type small acid-soluble spore protein [Crassaminicella indica]
MLTKRAKEIINSKDHLEVLYKGNSVWLENINTNTQMSTVRVLENNEIITIPVSELRETGRELK